MLVRTAARGFVRNSPPLPKKKKQKVGDGGSAQFLRRARLVNVAVLVWLYVRENEGSPHSWNSGITFMKSLKQSGDFFFFAGLTGSEEELLRSGTHTGNDGLSTKVRAPCF